MKPRNVASVDFTRVAWQDFRADRISGLLCSVGWKGPRGSLMPVSGAVTPQKAEWQHAD